MTAPQAGQTSPGAMAQYPPEGPVASSSTRLMMIAGGALLVFVLLIGGGLYLLSDDGPPPQTPAQPAQQSAKPPPSPAGAQVSAEMKTFTIEVMEGQAEVFRGGDRIGATPYKFDAKPGDQIDLVLKRDGYRDMPLRFWLSENKKIYTFTMQKNQ
jgi:hypothetical protein